MPFASIWLGLGLAVTSIFGRLKLTLKTCAGHGTQQVTTHRQASEFNILLKNRKKMKTIEKWAERVYAENDFGRSIATSLSGAIGLSIGICSAI